MNYLLHWYHDVRLIGAWSKQLYIFGRRAEIYLHKIQICYGRTKLQIELVKITKRRGQKEREISFYFLLCVGCMTIWWMVLYIYTHTHNGNGSHLGGFSVAISKWLKSAHTKECMGSTHTLHILKQQSHYHFDT